MYAPENADWKWRPNSNRYGVTSGREGCNLLTIGAIWQSVEPCKKPLMLADVKVLDFTQYLAGPTITRFMAEMGAEIIKVEQAPVRRSFAPAPIPQKWPQRLFHPAESRQEKPLSGFLQARTDRFAASSRGQSGCGCGKLRTGRDRAHGLDYPSLRAINPRLIMASISAFGRTGPLSHKVGYDFIAQAFSGLISVYWLSRSSAGFRRHGHWRSGQRRTRLLRHWLCALLS